MISNGNFHPMQLRSPSTRSAAGAAHVAMISERRMNKVMTIRFSDPKLMLAGLNDEQMAEQRPRRALVQYAAAALLAELKHLAAPVSIHLPPLDLDVEDHGTVAPSVVLTTRRALHLLDTILTCEAQMAIDLMDIQGVPKLGRGTRKAYEAVTRPGPPRPRRASRSGRRGDARRAALTVDGGEGRRVGRLTDTVSGVVRVAGWR